MMKADDEIPDSIKLMSCRITWTMKKLSTNSVAFSCNVLLSPGTLHKYHLPWHKRPWQISADKITVTAVFVRVAGIMR
jgi:hypothetical protein